MDPTRFDTVAKLFARRRLSRRQALGRGGAGLAAGALAAAGLAGVSAQNATPEVAPGARRGPAMLFLQSFRSGSVASKAGADGRYTLTLEQGLGQTIYFSDRPDRLVGVTPTPRFLANLGFPEDNPPNAALLVESGPNDTDLAVVELFAPRYDVATHTATYDVQVLQQWERTGLGFSEQPVALATLHPTFGAAHLFIDDCPQSRIYCSPMFPPPHNLSESPSLAIDLC